MGDNLNWVRFDYSLNSLENVHRLHMSLLEETARDCCSNWKDKCGFSSPLTLRWQRCRILVEVNERDSQWKYRKNFRYISWFTVDLMARKNTNFHPQLIDIERFFLLSKAPSSATKRFDEKSSRRDGVVGINCFHMAQSLLNIQTVTLTQLKRIDSVKHNQQST